MPNIKEKTDIELEIINPPMYKVILHNDDYTPMDLVVEILVKVFHKSVEEANDIMWQVHKKGKAVCGIYVLEIAQTKAHQVKTIAKANGYPLLATVERE